MKFDTLVFWGFFVCLFFISDTLRNTSAYRNSHHWVPMLSTEDHICYVTLYNTYRSSVSRPLYILNQLTPGVIGEINSLHLHSLIPLFLHSALG